MTDIDDPDLKFYTIDKVADIFEVTNQTVRTWIKNGALDAVKLPSGSFRIKHADLIEFTKKKFDVGETE